MRFSVQGTPHDTGLQMNQLYPINNYWEQARTLYAPFECTTTMKAGTTAVIKHTRAGRVQAPSVT